MKNKTYSGVLSPSFVVWLLFKLVSGSGGQTGGSRLVMMVDDGATEDMYSVWTY